MACLMFIGFILFGTGIRLQFQSSRGAPPPTRSQRLIGLALIVASVVVFVVVGTFAAPRPANPR